ncbi:6150_t:CDS:2 [Ambispora leptoticha]|uniref:6150_t:CDS:1 n=1 Tax=Ambispora leptoticha TaxID=144679 RepID=A0A9N8ZI86_9GLOM|nr:6150_t:CDS:2 [Ambispora leptoticha]
MLKNPAKKTKIEKRDNNKSVDSTSTSTTVITVGSSEVEINTVNLGEKTPDFLNTIYKLAKGLDDPAIRHKQQRDAIKILHSVMQNHLLNILLDDKASDILMCVFNRGRAPIKKKILIELEGDLFQIAQTDNGRRLIEIMLRERSIEKARIIQAFFGKVSELLKNKIGSYIMEAVYTESTSDQKARFISEVYGIKNSNDNSILKLNGIIDQNVLRKNEILCVVARNILNIVNEETIKHTIVQDMIIEYLTHTQIKEGQIITGKINKFIGSIVNTKNGIHLARLCFYHGTAKDRRIMLKSMVSKFASLCKSEYGHLLIVTIFESVDNVDMVYKVVLTEIILNLQKIMENDYGRICLVHLLTGRSALLPQETKRALASMDHIRSRASQKDTRNKMKKLAKKISPVLFRYIRDYPHKFFVSDNTGMILCVVLFYANGNWVKAVNRLIEFIKATPPQQNVMLSQYNRYLCMLAHNRFDLSQNWSLMAAPPNNLDFAVKLWGCIRNHLEFYATNAASSRVLASLLKINKVKSQVKIALKPHEEVIRQTANENCPSINWVAQHFGWTKFYTKESIDY